MRGAVEGCLKMRGAVEACLKMRGAVEGGLKIKNEYGISCTTHHYSPPHTNEYFTFILCDNIKHTMCSDG